MDVIALCSKYKGYIEIIINVAEKILLLNSLMIIFMLNKQRYYKPPCLIGYKACLKLTSL